MGFFLAHSRIVAVHPKLSTWLKADRHCIKRDRRTTRVLYQTIKQQGYVSSYGRVCAFVRRFKSEQTESLRKNAYVPLIFAA